MSYVCYICGQDTTVSIDLGVGRAMEPILVMTSAWKIGDRYLCDKCRLGLKKKHGLVGSAKPTREFVEDLYSQMGYPLELRPNHANYYLGDIRIARIEKIEEQFFLFFPHEELAKQGGKGPYSSFEEAEKEGLWDKIERGARPYIRCEME